MSQEQMTKEEIDASCIAAGQAIDIETCEVCWDTCNVADPYGVETDSYVVVGRVPFVRSPGGEGWVCLYWLSEDKARALHARVERGDVEPMDDFPF